MGHKSNAGNCVYFYFDFISRKKIKETVLLNYILKYIFLHKMDSYAAKVVIQNE